MEFLCLYNVFDSSTGLGFGRKHSSVFHLIQAQVRLHLIYKFGTFSFPLLWSTEFGDGEWGRGSDPQRR